MDLVVEDISNDNRVMIEFYEIHLEDLRTFPVSNLGPSVLKEVAVRLHETLYFGYDWRECAYEMGVTHNLDLARIQQSSEKTEELPMFITMTKTLQRIRGNVADIIRVFINTKRYNVLGYLEPYIKKLLENVPDTDVREFVNEKMQPPILRGKESNLSSEKEEVDCETVSSMFNTILLQDNRVMIEFYEIHLEDLRTFPVSNLRPSVLKTVAIMLHDKFYFESEWQECAYEMGVTHNLHLATIQQSTKKTTELPMFITMTKALQHIKGNVADIIRAFINTKRYDVLGYLEPYINKLLENVPDTDVKEFVNGKMQPPILRGKESNLSSEKEEVDCETVSSMFNTYTEQSENIVTAELDPMFTEKNTAIKFNALQKNSAPRDIISNLSKLSLNESLPPEIIISSAPVKESISVLIQHTENDVEVAKQLSAKLKGEGFAATTLFDMEMVIRMDPAGALSKVFQEVDFIVPVVSEEFLKLIDPRFCGDYDAMSNRTLYQLITTEYQYNGCMNFRIKSVLAPNMKKSVKLTNNCILNLSFKLWKEYETFVRVLKETKEIIQQSPLKRMIKAS